MKKSLLVCLMAITSIFASKDSFAQDTLFVYGPGGPLSAIKACADAFSKKSGIPVKVTGGPDKNWLEQAKANADLIYGGASYMLTQFAQAHPGMIDAKTRVELYSRAAGILVRPGNPKKIHKLEDLAKAGIKLLDVNGAGQLGMWEDIAGRAGLIAEIGQNIKGSYANTALGIQAWKEDQSYDAWISFSSWHNNLPDITELVPLSAKLDLVRGTPIAMTSGSRNRKSAQAFMEFLQTPSGHEIFKKWGWR